MVCIELDMTMYKTVTMIDPPSGWRYGFPKPLTLRFRNERDAAENKLTIKFRKGKERYATIAALKWS